MSAASKAALRVLEDLADQSVVDRAAKLVADGTHLWVFDPEVPGVAGLTRVGTRTADLLVYIADEDFEESSDFWA